MNRITFFTKEGCPLCESAWFVINKLKKRIDFELERVDITEPDNNQWYALYVNHIPVVHLNGQEVFRHHVSERKLRELLTRSTGSHG